MKAARLREETPAVSVIPLPARLVYHFQKWAGWQSLNPVHLGFNPQYLSWSGIFVPVSLDVVIIIHHYLNPLSASGGQRSCWQSGAGARNRSVRREVTARF